MPATKKQKTQPSLDSAPPRGDGLTEVPAEDDGDDIVDDPLDETKEDEQLDQETSSSSSSSSNKEIREIEFSTMVDTAQAKVNGKVHGGISLPARRAAERVYLDFPNRVTDIVKGPQICLN